MIKSLIAQKLKELILEEYKISDVSPQVDYPADDKWGDYSSNVALVLSKALKQSPVDIAKNISYRMSTLTDKDALSTNEYKLFSEVTVAGAGFINFKLSNDLLTNCIRLIIKSPPTYGSSNFGAGKKILVEYSSPNPNKPQHIGHARNNFLGYSLSQIFSFTGYEALKVNYINNMGVHICKSMLMYKKYGNGKNPDKKSDHFVGDFYIMFEKEAERNPAILEEASGMFRKLEAGDKETLELWGKIVNWAYEGWEKTYKDQKVSFDFWQYQNDYLDTGKEITQIALERGIAEKDETGAIIARLEKYDLPDKVLLRSDGTSIYSTQDLQLAKDSFEKYNLDKRLYVVDHRQEDYFRQIFKILDILGFSWAKNLHHISYGEVRLPDGPMSSRKGKVINADDVLSKLEEVEKDEISTRNNQKDMTDAVIKSVALAAFKYPMLKIDSKQDITFDYSIVTKFEGDTGPYIQYTFARAKSVLSKASLPTEFNLNSLPSSELELLGQISKFDEIVLKAADTFSPAVICNYIFQLAQRFNSFYNSSPILTAESEELKNARLMICFATSVVLQNGLRLLGIDAPGRM